MAKPHEIDYGTFLEDLVVALRKAWEETRSRRPGETFYLFGIETDSDITDLQPLCNTEEQYVADGGDAEPTVAKWFMNDDATLYRAGHKHTAALGREVNRYVFEDHTLHSEKAFRKRKRALLEVFEQALVQLDRERFFGTGRNRNRVLLQIAFVDADAAEWRHMLKVIKRINPPASTAAFFKSLKKQTSQSAASQRQEQHIKDLAIDFLRRERRAFDRCDCADRLEPATPFLMEILGETTAPSELWEVCFEAKNEPKGRLHGPGVMIVLVIPTTGKCVIAP